jgi:hypothetical protein
VWLAVLLAAQFAALSVTQDVQPKPHACVAGYAACCTITYAELL